MDRAEEDDTAVPTQERLRSITYGTIGLRLCISNELPWNTPTTDRGTFGPVLSTSPGSLSMLRYGPRGGTESPWWVPVRGEGKGSTDPLRGGRSRPSGPLLAPGRVHTVGAGALRRVAFLATVSGNLSGPGRSVDPTARLCPCGRVSRGREGATPRRAFEELGGSPRPSRCRPQTLGRPA